MVTTTEVTNLLGDMLKDNPEPDDKMWKVERDVWMMLVTLLSEAPYYPPTPYPGYISALGLGTPHHTMGIMLHSEEEKEFEEARRYFYKHCKGTEE